MFNFVSLKAYSERLIQAKNLKELTFQFKKMTSTADVLAALLSAVIALASLKDFWIFFRDVAPHKKSKGIGTKQTQ